MAPYRRFDHADQLLWMAGLRHPCVRAEAQAAHALSHRGGRRAHDHRQTGEAGAHALEVLPAPLPQHGKVDHQRVQPHGDQGIERHRAGERAVVPPERLEAIGQHLHETRIAVDDRQS